jgi:dihydroorotate dehydrogenase
MGAAVGQVPEYIEMVVRWCKQYTRMPVITKLTPNIADIRKPARAAHAGGTDAVSLINTINSITGVNLDTFSPEPMIDGKGTHGGYCGPAVKPIAMNMVAEIARDPCGYRLRKTSGSQRRSGTLSALAKDSRAFAFLGASTVNDAPPGHYAPGNVADGSEGNSVGRLVALGPDELLLILDGNAKGFELYQLIR